MPFLFLHGSLVQEIIDGNYENCRNSTSFETVLSELSPAALINDAFKYTFKYIVQPINSTVNCVDRYLHKYHLLQEQDLKNIPLLSGDLGKNVTEFSDNFGQSYLNAYAEFINTLTQEISKKTNRKVLDKILRNAFAASDQQLSVIFDLLGTVSYLLSPESSATFDETLQTNPLYEPVIRFSNSLSKSVINFSTALGSLASELDKNVEGVEDITRFRENIKEIMRFFSQLMYRRVVSDDTRLNALGAFLKEYPHTYPNTRIACSKVLQMEHCHPEDKKITKIYNRILLGRFTVPDLDAMPQIADRFLQGSQEITDSEFTLILRGHSDYLGNVINYFKDYAASRENIPEDDLKRLFKISHAFIVNCLEHGQQKNAAGELNIEYFDTNQSFFTLLLTIVKNNKENKLLLTHQTDTIQRMVNLLTSITDNYDANKASNETDKYIKEFIGTSFDILETSIKIPELLSQDYPSYIESIKQVIISCLKSLTCDGKESLHRAFTMFDYMQGQLKGANKEDAFTKITQGTKAFLEIACQHANLTIEELSSLYNLANCSSLATTNATQGATTSALAFTPLAILNQTIPELPVVTLSPVANLTTNITSAPHSQDITPSSYNHTMTKTRKDNMVANSDFSLLT